MICGPLLRRRVGRTSYLPGGDWKRGIPVAYLTELADYWLKDL